MEESPQEIVSIQTEHQGVMVQIDGFVIKTTQDCQDLLEYSKRMKSAQKAIAAELDPKISQAFRLHRGLTEMKTKFCKPFLDREKLCDSKVGSWSRARQIEAEENARKAREQAEADARREAEEKRKKLDEEKLSQAAKLAEAGFNEEADAVIAAPTVVVPQVIVPKPVEEPKLEGAHMRDNYSAEVFDFKVLVLEIAAGRQPLSMLLPNQKVLDDLAKSLKNELLIPGVKVINKPTLVKR